MYSVLNEILLLRKNKPPRIDSRNSNRYCLVTAEEDGSRTAYCFSTPIYEKATGKLLDLCFHRQGKDAVLVGSHARIGIAGDTVTMADEYGICRLRLPVCASAFSARKITCGTAEICPTANGIAVTAQAPDEGFSFELETDKRFLQIRDNTKCLALMQDKFTPYVTVSCIGTVDERGCVTAPAALSLHKTDDAHFILTLSPTRPAQRVMFEVNLYEPKLMQDTTVESRHPTENNAFGGQAFIGKTPQCGEQWLYLRIDDQKIPELTERRILRVMLHLRQTSAVGTRLTAVRTAQRFCSFGSNWNNKMPEAETVSRARTEDGYQVFDLTPLLVDARTRQAVRVPGIIIKATDPSGFAAVATADSYLWPAVLEVGYL